MVDFRKILKKNEKVGVENPNKKIVFSCFLKPTVILNVETHGFIVSAWVLVNGVNDAVASTAFSTAGIDSEALDTTEIFETVVGILREESSFKAISAQSCKHLGVT